MTQLERNLRREHGKENKVIKLEYEEVAKKLKEELENSKKKHSTKEKYLIDESLHCKLKKRLA